MGLHGYIAKDVPQCWDYGLNWRLKYLLQGYCLAEVVDSNIGICLTAEKYGP